MTVTEAAPELQTETAEVDSEINQTQLSQMPLTSSQGRNYEALYTMIPGAADVRENNSIGGNPSRAMMVNVNGNSANGNTTRIDGAIDYYGWLPYLIAYVTPADAVESVRVTTDDFNAEQGQAGGASIRVTTKSGGHDFHGGAWEEYQDGAINARPYTTTYRRFNPTRPEEHLPGIRRQHWRAGLYPQDPDRQKEAILLHQLRPHHAAPGWPRPQRPFPTR